MPPPMSMASAIFIRFSTTSILSLTFAPPRIATKGRVGLVYEARDAYNRSVSAVRRAEGVTDEDAIAKGSELLRECFVVLLFLGMEANVFQKEDIAVSESL